MGICPSRSSNAHYPVALDGLGPEGWRPGAIAFDAFGTIVEITDHRRPYHRLLRQARQGREAIDPLVTDIALRDWARSVEAGHDDIASAEIDLAAEVASIRLRDWVAPAWARIREAGVPIAVCSNLATPYGPPLMTALPDLPDAVILSYEVGLKKSDPAIYELVAFRLGLPPSEILFVGDTRTADYDGPRAAGMRAVPIEAFERTWGDVWAGPPPPNGV